MISYIASHTGDIAAALVLILLVGTVIWRMVRARKTGKGGCGCGCKGCANAPYCHPQSKPQDS